MVLAVKDDVSFHPMHVRLFGAKVVMSLPSCLLVFSVRKTVFSTTAPRCDTWPEADEFPIHSAPPDPTTPEEHQKKIVITIKQVQDAVPWNCGTDPLPSR
jgi:hypothetical protein